ncbi:hypothetical protein D3C76_423410 [compost metagenome]
MNEKRKRRSEEVTGRNELERGSLPEPEYPWASYATRSLGCFLTMENECVRSSLTLGGLRFARPLSDRRFIRGIWLGLKYPAILFVYIPHTPPLATNGRRTSVVANGGFSFELRSAIAKRKNIFVFHENRRMKISLMLVDL